jgi:hypothetical protein
MKKLKCLLCYLIRRKIVKQNLAIEIHIIGDDIEPFKTDYQLILKLLFNMYNLVSDPSQ